MRPVRIIATALFIAALAGTGCTARTANQTAASTTQPTAGSTGTTTATTVSPANATCALSPSTGPAGARVTVAPPPAPGRAGRGVPLSCRGFGPAEPVEVSFGATVLATATATAGGQIAASFAVPSGFAGSTIPGRHDTFQAKGRQSNKAASATFTVASAATAS